MGNSSRNSTQSSSRSSFGNPVSVHLEILQVQTGIPPKVRKFPQELPFFQASPSESPLRNASGNLYTVSQKEPMRYLRRVHSEVSLEVKSETPPVFFHKTFSWDSSRSSFLNLSMSCKGNQFLSCVIPSVVPPVISPAVTQTMHPRIPTEFCQCFLQ